MALIQTLQWNAHLYLFICLFSVYRLTCKEKHFYKLWKGCIDRYHHLSVCMKKLRKLFRQRSSGNSDIIVVHQLSISYMLHVLLVSCTLSPRMWCNSKQNLKISKENLEAVNRRTEKTMVKTIHRKVKIGQHEFNLHLGFNSGMRDSSEEIHGI